jgi:hypothetical protein
MSYRGAKQHPYIKTNFHAFELTESSPHRPAKFSAHIPTIFETFVSALRDAHSSSIGCTYYDPIL